MRQQVGGTVWQTAVGVGGICTGCCCCGNLCKCRAALLLLRLFATQVSSSSSSEQVRRWVGSPEPGHSPKHRPKWRLLHLHLQLGSLRGGRKVEDKYFRNLAKLIFVFNSQRYKSTNLQVLAHDHLSSAGKYNCKKGVKEVSWGVETVLPPEPPGQALLLTSQLNSIGLLLVQPGGQLNHGLACQFNRSKG